MTKISRITIDAQHYPQVALPSGATLTSAGPVMPGDSSGYCHRILLAQTVREWVTWDAAYPDDGNPAYCFNGHYFSTIEAAVADFSDRKRRGY